MRLSLEYSVLIPGVRRKGPSKSDCVKSLNDNRQSLEQIYCLSRVAGNNWSTAAQFHHELAARAVNRAQRLNRDRNKLVGCRERGVFHALPISGVFGCTSWQRWRQVDVGSSTRVDRCGVPGDVFSSSPWDQGCPIGSLAIRSYQARRFFWAGDIRLRKGPPHYIVDRKVSGCSSRRTSACQSMITSCVRYLR